MLSHVTAIRIRPLAAALVLSGVLLGAGGAENLPRVLATSGTPAGTAASAPLPVRLVIPSIHVDAAVEQLGDTADGAMEAPRQWADVGWYTPGFRPGDDGSAVMAGHRDSTTDRAVFWDLSRLKRGDLVQVQDDDGSQATFTVVSKASYGFNSVPMAAIFGAADAPRLNLVTCNGAFDWLSRNYDQRLVVYTQLLT